MACCSPEGDASIRRGRRRSLTATTIEFFPSLQKNKAVTETVWSLLAKGAAFLLYFTISVVLARALGNVAFGEWSFYFSAFTILLLVATLGIDTAARTYVARLAGTEHVARAVADGLKLRVAVGAAFAITLWLGGETVGSVLGRPRAGSLLRWSGPLLFCSGLLEYYKSVFTGAHRLKFTCLVIISEWTLKLAVVVAAAFFLVLTPQTTLVAFTAATFVAAIFGGAMLFRFFFRDGFPSGMPYAREILAYGVPMFLLTLGGLALTELNTLILGMLSTEVEVGFFAIGKDLTMKVPHAALALAMGSGPLFANIAGENRLKVQRLFLRIVKITAAIIALPMALFLFGAPFFVPLVYGQAYLPSVLPLQMMSVYMLCFSLSIIPGTVLDYQKLAWVRVRNLAIGTVLNVALCLWLVPRYGAVGAAASATIAFLPYTVLNFTEVHRVLFRPATPPTA